MSKKFVIRIKNLKEHEEYDQQKGGRRVVTIVHWHRIIATALVSMVVVALLAWLLTSFFSGLAEDHDDLLPEVLSSADIAADFPDIFVQPDGDSVLSDRSTNAQSGANDASDIHPDTRGVVSAEQLVGEMVLSVVENDIPVMLDSHQASDIQEEQRQKPLQPEADEEKTISDALNQNAVETPKNVVIYSRNIRRAQLTSWVKQKEPVDQLGSEIIMKNDQLIRVFLFTDMGGLKGKTLYHTWYLDDKRMARVDINVKSDSVRASSSKFIDKYMLGSWKVMVTDDSGEVLIFASFDVKRSE